jgi:hypothetical protein
LYVREVIKINTAVKIAVADERVFHEHCIAAEAEATNVDVGPAWGIERDDGGCTTGFDDRFIGAGVGAGVGSSAGGAGDDRLSAAGICGRRATTMVFVLLHFISSPGC